MIVEFSIYVREKIGAREGRTLDECRDPWINPRRPIVRRGRGRGRDSETVTCRLNVTQDSRLFHSLPEERSFSLSLFLSTVSSSRNNSREEMVCDEFRAFSSRFSFQSYREREKNLKRERERGVSEFILSVGGACTASHVARRGGREPYA